LSKFLYISFGRLYQLYTKWGNVDAYYHTAFVFGILLASVVNFIIAILYYQTCNTLLKFGLFPIGTMLILIIGFVIFYFHKRKNLYVISNKNLPKKLTKDDWLSIVLMIMMFSTWFITPLFYKWGSLN